MSDCRGGIILIKRFYTELICPGSALGGTIDISVTGIFGFGSLKLCSPETPIERQQAFQTRLNQSNYLQHLMQEKSETNRARLLLQQIHALVGRKEMSLIPADLLGQLIGLDRKVILSACASMSFDEGDCPDRTALATI